MEENPELFHLPLGAVTCRTNTGQEPRESFSIRLLPSIPVMIRINGQPIHITANHDARLLLSLLRAVMAKLAQALKVGAVEEQRHVTSVGFDMVSNDRGYGPSLRSTPAA